jgi:membrane-bound lytic murein transglycosylase F
MHARRYCYSLFILLLSIVFISCNDSTDSSENSASGKQGISGSGLSRELGDIDSLKKTGQLRILVHSNRDVFLPRNGLPQELDQDMLERFASEQGLEMTVVSVEDFNQLIPSLLDGRGDIIAANLTVTDQRKQRLAFTVPLDLVSEHLLSSTKQPLTALSQLDQRTIAVQQGTTFWDAAEKLKNEFPGLLIKPLPGDMSNDEIFEFVNLNPQYLTLADSNIIDTFSTYRQDLQSSAALAGEHPVAWAVRPGNPKLLLLLNEFITTEMLVRVKKENSFDDFDGIKKRKKLRVALRNNSASYFLWRGELLGFDYELISAFAKKHQLLIEIVVPPNHEKLIDYVRTGKADIAAGFLSITKRREQNGVVFSQPYHYASELIVTKKDDTSIQSIKDLAGRNIHTRKSSSYWQTMQNLQQEVAFNLLATAETEETEEAIAKVASGEYDLTVTDNHILDIELTWRDDVDSAMPLGEPKKQGWVVRESNPQLLKELNVFIDKEYRSLFYNMAYKKYFKAPKGVAKLKRGRLDFIDSGSLSPYDDTVKIFAEKYNFEWRLLVAQMYQESRFDPDAESWAGAVGLFQVMPRTARELGYKDLRNPQIGIEAGVKYLSWTWQRFSKSLTVRDRLWFSLAAYNAGIGHVRDARKLARQEGLNPNRWFGHVEKAMLLLSKREYAAKARYGYVRGQEPVNYVRDIRNRFNAYIELTENFSEPAELTLSDVN